MLHRHINFDVINWQVVNCMRRLTSMQFLRTKQVPEMRLRGNHNILSSTAGGRHNTWKPASSSCMIACSLTGWVEDIFNFRCRNEVRNKVAFFLFCFGSLELVKAVGIHGNCRPVTKYHFVHMPHDLTKNMRTQVKYTDHIGLMFLIKTSAQWSCMKKDILICCCLGADERDIQSHSHQTNNTFHCSNTIVWFCRPIHGGVWWAFVSIVSQTMNPSISLSVLPGGGRTHSITGFTSSISNNACARVHWNQKDKSKDNRDTTEYPVGIFALYEEVKATMEMSRNGLSDILIWIRRTGNDVVSLCKEKLLPRSIQWCAVGYKEHCFKQQ